MATAKKIKGIRVSHAVLHLHGESVAHFLRRSEKEGLLAPRYFAGALGEQRGGPMTAREMRDWKARVQIGKYSVRFSESDGDWQLFVETVVGSVSPSETWAYVDSFTLYREALAAAKRKAREALRRSARRLP